MKRHLIKGFDSANMVHYVNYIKEYDDYIVLRRLSTPLFTKNPVGNYSRDGRDMFLGKNLLWEIFKSISISEDIKEKRINYVYSNLKGIREENK